MPVLDKELIEKAGKSIFSIWADNSDYSWFRDNIDVFNWHYSNPLELEELKLKIVVIGNWYYEFVHEGYDDTYELSDFLAGDFEEAGLPLSPFRLGQLLGEDFSNELYDIEDDFEELEFNLVNEAIREYVSSQRRSIFKELYKRYTPDTLFESLSAITNSEPDFKGYLYLESWGDSYSNF